MCSEFEVASSKSQHLELCSDGKHDIDAMFSVFPAEYMQSNIKEETLQEKIVATAILTVYSYLTPMGHLQDPTLGKSLP